MDFEFVGKFTELLPLEAIKQDPVLMEMMICQRGTRLSITPVDPLHFKRACKLAGIQAGTLIPQLFTSPAANGRENN